MTELFFHNPPSELIRWHYQCLLQNDVISIMKPNWTMCRRKCSEVRISATSFRWAKCEYNSKSFKRCWCLKLGNRTKTKCGSIWMEDSQVFNSWFLHHQWTEMRKWGKFKFVQDWWMPSEREVVLPLKECV